MIDLANETVISLTEATKHLPARRRGKRPAVTTLYRWAQHGCHGIRLETIRVGDTCCTSLEALQRFCDRLTADAERDPVPVPASPSRQRDIERAEREMARPLAH